MAELDVVRKKKSPFPWIILALVLLAIAAFFIWNYSKNDADTDPAVTDSTIVADTTRVAP